MAVSGLVDAPIDLAVDSRDQPGLDACPEDPDPGTPVNEAACGTVTAVASEDIAVPVSGSTVTLDAAASSADSCVNGHLEYQWRVGGSIVQDFSTSAILIDAPLKTTEYTVTVRCSTDKLCFDEDNVVVVILDQREASATPSTLMEMSVVPGPPSLLGNPWGDVLVTAWEPAIGGCGAMRILRTDLRVFSGENELRDTVGSPGPVVNASMCKLTPPPGAFPSPLNPSSTVVLPGGEETPGPGVGPRSDNGDIYGYLAIATCQGINGQLGQGRGSVNPLAPPSGTCTVPN
jgi:hypothetical protein